MNLKKNIILLNTVITVASCDHVYVYKNLRPFFRAVLPPLPVNQVERDIWGQVSLRLC